MCQVVLKLTLKTQKELNFIIKTPEQIVLVFPLLTLNKLITAGTGLYISKNDLPEN